MSRNVSMWGRVVQNLRKSLTILRRDLKPPLRVGQDTSGNVYFERQAEVATGFKGTRWVENPSLDRMTVPQVPAEWESWLRGRRREPPTDAEMKANRLVIQAKQAGAKALELQRSSSSDGETTARDMESGSCAVASEPSRKHSFPKRDDYELYAGESAYKDQKKQSSG